MPRCLDDGQDEHVAQCNTGSVSPPYPADDRLTFMLPLVALLVEPLFAYRLKRREEVIHTLLARIRFFSSALDNRSDFSSIHHFPEWIEDTSNQILKLDPSNRYALHMRTRLREFRARAIEIIATRHPV